MIPHDKLLAHHISGWEEINRGFRFEVHVLSEDAFIELKEMEGLPFGCTILTASGSKRQINGVVTTVTSMGSDGGLASYLLVLEPATSALILARGNRVFLGKSYAEAGLQILQEQIQDNPVFTTCFSIDNRCWGRFPKREFIFMNNESPWDFFRRCMAKEGISFVFAPAKESTQDHPQHCIVLFGDSQDLDENEAGVVRFHRIDGTERTDAITHWFAQRTLQCGHVTCRTYDHNTGSLHTTTEALKSDQGPFGNALASTLEEYRHESPLEHDDAQAFEGRTVAHARTREQQTKHFGGTGNVRDFRAGTTFALIQHPLHDQDSPQDRKFVLTRVELEGDNNLPKTLGEGLDAIQGGTGAKAAEAAGQVYRNRFDCIRMGIPILPDEVPFKPFGYLTATVVGPGNESVHTDALGRIKIRLHVTRPDDHEEAGASNTDKDSFWIRLVLPWSSQGMGGTMIPRVGDEVLVAALNNDPDKLVVIGVLPGGVRKPGRFSDASALPGDKAISGLRSRMHGGITGNEFLMDDTPRELRARIASDHASTELNLGYNVHPRKNGTAMPKGEGAELRTDASVAIRGGNGVFISADARPKGGGNQLSREEALGHLSAAMELSKTLGDLGGKHGMDALETGPQQELLKMTQDWEKGTNTDPRQEGGKRPIFLATAPAGIAMVSGEATTVQASNNLDLVAMRHTQMSAGKRMLFHAMESIGLFAHRMGMKLIAASGDISIQAQDGPLELIAAKILRLMSVGGRIELDAAKGIILRSGGAFVEIKDGKVTAGGPGGWRGQFASVSWSGPESQNAKVHAFGKSSVKTNEFFRIVQGQAPMKGIRYEIALEDGRTIGGRTDGDGRTTVAADQMTQKAQLKVYPDDIASE